MDSGRAGGWWKCFCFFPVFFHFLASVLDVRGSSASALRAVLASALTTD